MKILLISDTHTKHGYIDYPLTGIDMIICSGDVTINKVPAINHGQALDFFEWYKSLFIQHKIYVPGNHDTAFERGYLRDYDFEDIHVLVHEYKEIAGLKIFGSPYTPTFGTDWAYNKDRSKLHKYWQDIPEDLDILITHGPPQGVLDLSKDGVLTGCKALANRVKEVKPKIHMFGHIHEWAGYSMEHVNSATKFINAAVVELSHTYELNNNGQIIEL